MYKHEPYYVDTERGIGVDKVIKDISPLLNKMASKTYLGSEYSFSDIKQELVIITINGIKNYDPEKSTSLSTFLHIHVKNKLYTIIQQQRQLKKNASLSQNDFHQEVLFSDCNRIKKDGENMFFENSIEEEDSCFENRTSTDHINHISSAILFDDILKNSEEHIIKAVDLICFKDYTLSEASEELGISSHRLAKNIRKVLKRKYIDNNYEG